MSSAYVNSSTVSLTIHIPSATFCGFDLQNTHAQAHKHTALLRPCSRCTEVSWLSRFVSIHSYSETVHPFRTLSMSSLTQSHKVVFGRPHHLIRTNSEVIQRLIQSSSCLRSGYCKILTVSVAVQFLCRSEK